MGSTESLGEGGTADDGPSFPLIGGTGAKEDKKLIIRGGNKINNSLTIKETTEFLIFS